MTIPPSVVQAALPVVKEVAKWIVIMVVADRIAKALDRRRERRAHDKATSS